MHSVELTAGQPRSNLQASMVRACRDTKLRLRAWVWWCGTTFGKLYEINVARLN